MKKIKVVEYIHSLGDGGAETLVKDYVRLMDKNVFDPVVVVTRIYGDTANLRAVKAANIPVITIYPCWNVFMKAFDMTFGRWYVPHRLRRIFKKEDAKVLHVHLGMLSFVSHVGELLNGMKILYTCHNEPRMFFNDKKPGERKAAEFLIKNHNMQMIALHDAMAIELNEVFNIKNSIVIRNGIDFKRFKDLPVTKEVERERLGIPSNAFVVGHVGRFFAQKNHPFLVEIFNEVAKKNNNAFLLMVGAGNTKPIEDKLKEYGLKDRYLILSHRSDINEIMRSMDMFVLPSLFEGLPLVLIEAQVSNLKCVASNTINQEAFKTEKAISLPIGDAKHWAEVILDENAKGTPNGNLDDYDMNKEIKRLERLYAGEDVI